MHQHLFGPHTENSTEHLEYLQMFYLFNVPGNNESTGLPMKLLISLGKCGSAYTNMPVIAKQLIIEYFCYLELKSAVQSNSDCVK